MKTTWVYKLVKYLKKVYFKNDKRVAAYLVCVAIATGFWFLNALSKTYTVKIIAPVEYNNFPRNKTFTGNLPENFEMTVRAHGFTILRHKLSFLFGPLSFNVNEMTNSRMLDIKKNNSKFQERNRLLRTPLLLVAPNRYSIRFSLYIPILQNLMLLTNR